VAELVIFQCDRCGREYKEPKGFEPRKLVGIFNGSQNDPTFNPITGLQYPTETTQPIEVCSLCYEAMKFYFLGKTNPKKWLGQGLIDNERYYIDNINGKAEPA
jgi:hypothetical protein